MQACNDYLRMGPGRSLRKLQTRYDKAQQNTTPTTSFDTLAKWSTAYDWTGRSAAYDAAQDAARTVARQREFQRGLALDFARVRKLKRLAEFLEGQIYEQGAGGVYHNVWVPDVKTVGSGPSAERVDLERFNGDLLTQYRDTLADLAKETGGRVQKTALTDPSGQQQWQPGPDAVQAALAVLGLKKVPDASD